MTTSSSEAPRGTRCTRISPSAILDDRLTGRDLDWARDHLRRCDTCRDRVEDFQEMRLRLERLAHAPVGNAAIEDAFVVVVPQALRPLPSQARLVGAPPAVAQVEAELRSPAHQAVPPPPLDVASVPDLLSELEHEIFHDDPWASHSPGFLGGTAEAEAEHLAEAPAGSEPVASAPDEVLDEPLVEAPPHNLRQVSVDSGPRIEAASTPVESTAPAPERRDEEEDWPLVATVGPPARSDTAIRLAVGLGAAGCVLLAALLYESGLFPSRPTASASSHVTPSAQVSHRVTPSPTFSPSAAPSPTPPPAAVLARLGQGVAGESVFRIRPGTANPTWTRLVFDLTGQGLPSMVIAQPDALHLQVTFLNTTGADVPVAGIHSRQVLGLEHAVQQGSDLMITVDLAAPMRLVDFTLPPEPGYAPRLVLDIHSS